MKLVEIRCPTCGAGVKINLDEPITTCEFCGGKLLLDDETQHIKFDDMRQSGYEFEKGRLMAQKEELERIAREDEERKEREKREAAEIRKRQAEMKANKRTEQMAQIQEQKKILRKKYCLAVLFAVFDLVLIIFTIMFEFKYGYACIPLLLLVGFQIMSPGDRIWNGLTIFTYTITLIIGVWEIGHGDATPTQFARDFIIICLLIINAKWRKDILNMKVLDR